MADFWKSQPRKFCDFCKCWIADNKPSREFHERGKRHTENVQRKLDDLKKKGVRDAIAAKETSSYMAQMEKAAMKKFQEDLASDPQLAARYAGQIKTVKREKLDLDGESVDRKKIGCQLTSVETDVLSEKRSALAIDQHMSRIKEEKGGEKEEENNPLEDNKTTSKCKIENYNNDDRPAEQMSHNDRPAEQQTRSVYGKWTCVMKEESPLDLQLPIVQSSTYDSSATSLINTSLTSNDESENRLKFKEKKAVYYPYSSSAGEKRNRNGSETTTTTCVVFKKRRKVVNLSGRRGVNKNNEDDDN